MSSCVVGCTKYIEEMKCARCYASKPTNCFVILMFLLVVKPTNGSKYTVEKALH